MEQKKLSAIEIHLEVLKLIISVGLISKVKVMEYIAEKYSQRETTQRKIINKLRQNSLIEEKKGADNIKYLAFKKGK